MKLKELIRQLKEYEKIYSPDMEVITRYQQLDPMNEIGEDFKINVNAIVDGIDYLGDLTILICSHIEDED
jgi:hypothetical protein